jgi:hypothetical protein
VTGVVLLNALGRPEPSPEVSRRLQAIHAGLHLRFIDAAEEHWSVCMAWQPEDTRWSTVQSGEISPDRAFDIIGYLPMLCSADEAPSYLERMFRTFPRDDVQRMSDAMSNWNTDAIHQAYESALSDVLDRPNPTVL